jgi:hypothetical protein
MTKYTLVSRRRSTAATQQTHVVWRGIGCVLMMVIPLISWVLAAITVRIALAQAWPMPYQLLGNPVMPRLLWRAPGLVPLLAFIERQQNLYAVLLVTVAYIVIVSGLMTVLYAIIYRFTGPPRYGPLDAPPPKVSVERYKR